MATQYLLAVSVNANKDAELRGDRPAILARYPSIAAATRASPPIYPFVHTCEPNRARAWMQYASRFSAVDINAMSPADQINAVKDAWTAFGKAFQAMNLRPYGWSRLRRRAEEAWGGVPQGDNPASPQSSTYWGGRKLEESNGPDTAMPGVWVGSWRTLGFDLARGQRARDTQWMGPQQVIFGGEDDWNFSNIACRPLSAEQMPDDCSTPTGEVHRLWLQGDGRLSGYKDYSEAEIARQFSYGMGAGWDRWAAEPSFPVAGSDRLYILPPLRWYWELLFAPVRGLQVPGVRPQRGQLQVQSAVAVDGAQGPARVLGLPEGYDPSLDLSLAEYFLALRPEEFVREVMRDVVIRNNQMAHNHGLSASRARELQTAGSDALLNDAEEAGNLLQTMTTAGFSIAGAVAAINPVAGLIAGAGVVVAYVLYKIAATETRNIDVFGRQMPTYEKLAYADGEERFESMMTGLDSPPDSIRPPINLALASRRAAETPLSLARMLALTSLTVTSAIPGTTVAVNGPGEDNEAFPAPWGPRGVPTGVQMTIKVNAPGRVPRELAVSLVPGEQKRLDIASGGMELATRTAEPYPEDTSGGGRVWPWVLGAGALALAGAVVYRSLSGQARQTRQTRQTRQNPRRRRRAKR